MLILLLDHAVLDFTSVLLGSQSLKLAVGKLVFLASALPYQLVDHFLLTETIFVKIVHYDVHARHPDHRGKVRGGVNVVGRHGNGDHSSIPVVVGVGLSPDGIEKLDPDRQIRVELPKFRGEGRT